MNKIKSLPTSLLLKLLPGYVVLLADNQCSRNSVNSRVDSGSSCIPCTMDGSDHAYDGMLVVIELITF